MLTSFLNFFRRNAEQITRQDFYRVGRWFLMINGVLAIGAFAYLHQPYRVIYNNTWSMPRGVWVYDVRVPKAYALGDTVSAYYNAPQWIANRKWYDPLHNSLLKDVAGVPGDHLKVEKGTVFNCGADGEHCRALAKRIAWDSAYHPLYVSPLPKVIPPRHYFLLGENPVSLDSRYLGLFTLDSIRGLASKVLTRKIPEKAKKLIGNQVLVEALPVKATQHFWIPEDEAHPRGWGHYDRKGNLQWENGSASQGRTGQARQRAPSDSPLAQASGNDWGNDFAHARKAGANDSQPTAREAVTVAADKRERVTHSRSEAEGVWR